MEVPPPFPPRLPADGVPLHDRDEDDTVPRRDATHAAAADSTVPAAGIAVVVVEDDAIVRDWVRLAFSDSEFRLAGQATSAIETTALLKRRRPSLLLVDYRLADGTGTDLVRELRAGGESTPVLLMTAKPTEGFNELARETGAQGSVLKTGSRDELLTALRAVLNHEAAFDSRHPKRSHDRPPLSARERQVLRLIAGGATNREIARELGIGNETIKTICARAYVKLGARRRAEAIAAAQERGLL